MTTVNQVSATMANRSPRSEAAAARLPISVVVPTLNSATAIDVHLASILEWHSLVEEIIVVDSYSQDDTVERVLKKLPRAKIISTAPGLYSSWNKGVEQCSAEYVYFSTVGDTITVKGMRSLAQQIRDLNADIIVSLPKISNFLDGRCRLYEWAPHRFVKHSRITSTRVVAPVDFLVASVLYLPLCMLGSSASNLYRADVLRRMPFPEDSGSNGDTLWTMRHGLRASVAISPQVLSTFLLHGQPEPSIDEQNKLQARCINEALVSLRKHKALRDADARVDELEIVLRSVAEAHSQACAVNGGQFKSRAISREISRRDLVAARERLCVISNIDIMAAELIEL